MKFIYHHLACVIAIHRPFSFPFRSNHFRFPTVGHNLLCWNLGCATTSKFCHISKVFYNCEKRQRQIYEKGCYFIRIEQSKKGHFCCSYNNQFWWCNTSENDDIPFIHLWLAQRIRKQISKIFPSLPPKLRLYVNRLYFK